MMPFKIPTREEAVVVAEELIRGERDPIEVGLRAGQIGLPENEKHEIELEKKDPELQDFLYSLSTVDFWYRKKMLKRYRLT